MHYYKVVVKGGHVGTGKYRELIFYIAAKDAFQAIDEALKMPGVKHKFSALIGLNEISHKEFVKWRGTSAYKR